MGKTGVEPVGWVQSLGTIETEFNPDTGKVRLEGVTDLFRTGGTFQVKVHRTTG